MNLVLKCLKLLTYNVQSRRIYAYPFEHCFARNCSQFGHTVAAIIPLTIKRTYVWIFQPDLY